MPGIDRLSPRERQVYEGRAAGQTLGQIALTLGISPKTAESYSQRIWEKMNPPIWGIPTQRLALDVEELAKYWLTSPVVNY